MGILRPLFRNIFEEGRGHLLAFAPSLRSHRSSIKLQASLTTASCMAVTCTKPHKRRYDAIIRLATPAVSIPNTPPTGSVSVVLLDCILRGFGVSVATHKSRCELSTVNATVLATPTT